MKTKQISISDLPDAALRGVERMRAESTERIRKIMEGQVEAYLDDGRGYLKTRRLSRCPCNAESRLQESTCEHSVEMSTGVSADELLDGAKDTYSLHVGGQVFVWERSDETWLNLTVLEYLL